ncbi:MAG: 2,3-bisphosphoglycerate-dependent phosphoglycerate mutase [Patescibacteria group bacterium]|jgi:2,3-bisphosphoglycerate-dependent phosphoglycerate mutase
MGKGGKRYKIYLFRHGMTTYNRDHRFTGWNDARLTVEGNAHAKLIAKKMKNKKFGVAIHTRLSRSKDTLKPVLIGHDECRLVLQDDRMIERSYGELQGRLHSSVITEIGREKFESWHRGYGVKHRPPKGECFLDVEKRVKSFIVDLKKLIGKHKVNVAISAHGNSIRMFRKIMEKSSIAEMQKWNIAYDRVYTYYI